MSHLFKKKINNRYLYIYVLNVGKNGEAPEVFSPVLLLNMQWCNSFESVVNSDLDIKRITHKSGLIELIESYLLSFQ